MVETPSSMKKLGFTAPSFSLPDVVSNQIVSLDALKGVNGTVVMFICNHCPYVIHINQKLVEISQQYQAKGINFIAISSNDADKYPQDGPEKMKQHAKDNHYPFPYLYDETQDIARAFNAACTPDFFLFDAELSLIYRGQFDESRPSLDIMVTGNSLVEAMDATLNQLPPIEKQRPSLGCNIKWKTVA